MIKNINILFQLILLCSISSFIIHSHSIVSGLQPLIGKGLQAQK
jgi:hypothetical protein